MGARLRASIAGFIVASIGLAGAGQAMAMRGALSAPGAEHAAVGVLERGGVPVCTASLIGPGWAITAAHCLDERPQSLRLLGGTNTALALGPAQRSPDDGDLALIEVPEAAALALPHLAIPAPLGAPCRLEPRPVVAMGAWHLPSGALGRSGATAELMIYEECDPGRYTPMLLAPEGTPAALCPGDSGAPVVQRDASGAIIQAVVVSQIATGASAACGRDHFAIGFVEPLRTDARQAWLARTTTAPRAPRAFGVSLAVASADRVRVRLSAWQASPPPGARVTLVTMRGRVWGRATVARSGAVTIRRPPPGTYRLRASGPAGTRLSRPIRIR